MTERFIEESGMKFGPFPEEHCFVIEKSNVYKKIQEGVKTVDFLVLKQNGRKGKDGKTPVIWFVEAKSSAPKSFNDYIDEIRDKMIHSFSLCWACILKRHSLEEAELPEPFKSLDLSLSDVRFVLVISDNKVKLPPLQDALRKDLKAINKTWALSPNSVVVINERTAGEKGLIKVRAGEKE